MKRYVIMHGSRSVAAVTQGGECRIFAPAFMPYALWLEESQEMDDRIQNITNFYYWCASRLITLDRQFAKEILNSIGAGQYRTDRERAQIALAYHCLSLTDIYWVREEDDSCSWESINLYDNHLSNAFVDVSLRGKQITASNMQLAQDLSTSGCFPKAWQRREDGFYLLKDGDEDAVKREVLASKVCQCFACRQVVYQEEDFEGQTVSASRIFTDKKDSIVTREAFEIYMANHEPCDLSFSGRIMSDDRRENDRQKIDALAYIKELDPEGYFMMNILDYLTGNTDRHWGNWGLLIDNGTNLPTHLHPLMDMNRAFFAYEDIEGAGCLPEYRRRISQREGAVEAVQKIGLRQVREIDPAWFAGREAWYEMLKKRLEILKSC